MTDANRNEAQAELRQLIQDAFNAQTLWTTDWAGMTLTRLEISICLKVDKLTICYASLEPKVPSVFNQGGILKRKAYESSLFSSPEN